jgi:hypothetical protein
VAVGDFEPQQGDVEMLRTIAGAALLAIAAIPFSASGASAAGMTPMTRLPAMDNLIEKTQYRYCRRWNRECRYRWGYGWRYRRCMRIRGC